MVEGDHTFASVTDKISDVTLKKRTPFHWFIGFGIAFLVAQLLLFTIVWLVDEGYRHLGNQPAGRMGFPDHQFRLVDRYRPRRNADLGDPAAFESEMANVDQPLCRGDDAVRGGLRGIVSGVPYRPSVARVLAFPVSEHDGNLAAVPSAR